MPILHLRCVQHFLPRLMLPKRESVSKNESKSFLYKNGSMGRQKHTICPKNLQKDTVFLKTVSKHTIFSGQGGGESPLAPSLRTPMVWLNYRNVCSLIVVVDKWALKHKFYSLLILHSNENKRTKFRIKLSLNKKFKLQIK